MNPLPTEEKAFIILLGIFTGAITIASVLAGKIITIGGLCVPAGVLAYSVTFVVSDVISEIWGKERARYTVISGFFGLVIVLVLVQIALYWPAAPFYKEDAAFSMILGSTTRIIIASFAAYLISQFHDVWFFHELKKMTHEKHLWLRNNLSTALSQFIDSFIFITIAFVGVMPIWPLILGQWVVKLVIAFLDTPVVYTVVWIIRRSGSGNNAGPSPIPATTYPEGG